MLRDDKIGPAVDIAADGDLILVVGPENIRLRVYSLTLKSTSKPFSAMLGPDWKEGRALEDGCAELLLPEDDAVAMEYICAIIHHQNMMLPTTMAPYDILKVAVAADKYNFVDALRFASKSWLYPCNAKAAVLMVLAAAAYAFQDPQAFRNLTKSLILNHGGSYRSLSIEGMESVMHWRVFCKNSSIDSTSLFHVWLTS
ncbi:hypothetical protein BJX99DRAFT_255740 [Aspergillus californicus]